MKRLFIAEKPNMAAEIAKCLGKGNEKRKRGYFVIGSGQEIVTWSYGHILRQFAPEEYDIKYKNRNVFPILPKEWKMKVSEYGDSAAQLAIIKNLCEDADEIVHAGDPDREGQLLVDEILDFVGNKKPVKRILLNALDEKSIRDALDHLRDNKEFFGLKQSALARSRADWLFGMNLSRAYTSKTRKAGYEHDLRIGRVKTPTMSLVVRREQEIQNFKPVKYYTIDGIFTNGAVEFSAAWKSGDTCAGLDSESRLIDKKVAEDLLQKFLQGDRKAVVKEIETKEKQEAQRLPYSLSSLQVEAGKLFGYDPQTVLEVMQELYEKKLTTYPRSDCEYLPENQIEDAKTILGNLNALDRANLNLKSRAWNDKKISAHHAIIPTTLPCPEDLSETQANLYRMVATAYIAQFLDVHIYSTTKLRLVYMDEIFTTSGKTVTQPGWRSLYPTKEKENLLPDVSEGEILTLKDGQMKNKATTPPKRFTPAELLQAMKDVHKYVKNEKLKTQLKNVQGIGTEATRAKIIDDLIQYGFLVKEKKCLLPSETAKMMVAVLPEELTYPDTTALWEEKLAGIVDGKISLEDFLREGESALQDMLKNAARQTLRKAAGAVECPVCKQGVLRKMESKKSGGFFWGCTNYPDCTAIFTDDNGKPIVKLCPVCGKGPLRKLKSKKDAKKFFWACGNSECKMTFMDKNGTPLLRKK